VAEVWISEPDESSRLSRTDSAEFVRSDTSPRPGIVITVDPDRHYQVVDGMGSSLEPATCFNLSIPGKEERRQTLEVLVSYNFDYYMYGHFMKFIKPGSVRISSEGGGTLTHVAFSDPEGKTVLIVVNAGNQEVPVSITSRGLTASVNIKKNSIITLRW
jgi:O-glycosyl hydrolase